MTSSMIDDTQRRIRGIEEWIDAALSRRYRAVDMLAHDPSWSIVIAGIDADLALYAIELKELQAIIKSPSK